MLSCNPSVFCMAPVDYSTYQRTQNALCRITFSFFDGYAVNIAVHSFEGILFFHTRYKHSLNELPFFIGLQDCWELFMTEINIFKQSFDVSFC